MNSSPRCKEEYALAVKAITPSLKTPLNLDRKIHGRTSSDYEMLRLVNVDKRPISEAAKACGFSRPSFYQAQAAFEHGGLAALIAHKPGPHGGHKLTPAVLQFVIEARTADPGVRADRLAEWVHQRFGVHVHPRSIERQLLRKKKRR